MALNVLIVDDSAVMRAMIAKSLHMSGLPLGEVHEASNGQEGLVRLTTDWVDLCLVDINMPVMDGEQMVALARERPELADLPIIVVSTEGSQTRIDRLKNLGVRFVHKPFAPRKIREVVHELLEITRPDLSAGDTADSYGTDF